MKKKGKVLLFPGVERMPKHLLAHLTRHAHELVDVVVLGRTKDDGSIIASSTSSAGFLTIAAGQLNDLAAEARRFERDEQKEPLEPPDDSA
jgi:hypothetical protein